VINSSRLNGFRRLSDIPKQAPATLAQAVLLFAVLALAVRSILNDLLPELLRIPSGGPEAAGAAAAHAISSLVWKGAAVLVALGVIDLARQHRRFETQLRMTKQEVREEYKQVEGNPVFTYHDVFNSDKAEVDELKERYRKGTVGDVEVKQKLFNALDAFLGPIRERRTEFAAKPERVREIIMEGTRKGRMVAQATMDEVRAAMKLNYKLS